MTGCILIQPFLYWKECLELYHFHFCFLRVKNRNFSKIPYKMKTAGRLHFTKFTSEAEHSGRSSFTSKTTAAQRQNQWRPTPENTSKPFPTVSPRPIAFPNFLSLLLSFPPSLLPSTKDVSSSFPLHLFHTSLLLPPLLLPITTLQNTYLYAFGAGKISWWAFISIF